LLESPATDTDPPPPEAPTEADPLPGSAGSDDGAAGAAKVWHPELGRPVAGAAAPKAWLTWLAGKLIAPATAPATAQLTAIEASPRPRPRRSRRRLPETPTAVSGIWS
jgi:hypothetical protein